MTTPPKQSRAARSLLGWTQPDLAKAANIGQSTVADFETGKRTPIPNNMQSIQSALETAGITFIPENGGGLGVRLRERG